MQHAGILFDIAVPLYGCACVLYLWSILGGAESTTRAATWSAALGLLAHGAGIVAMGIDLHRIPFTNLFESLTLLSWLLVAIYLAIERRHRIPALGAFATIIGLCLTGAGTMLPRTVSESLVPALRSYWSSVHVLSCLASYACLTLAFGAALCYVTQEYLLKSKRSIALQKRLPSLDVADRLAYKLVSLGFPLLTLGIVTGAMWAQSAWGSYWSWDPKETWSLITWLVYAAYLHVRILSRWRGRWANRLLIAGFVSIVLTYVGVNLLSQGLHKYNW